MLDDPYYQESIIRPNCRHKRLRVGKAIAGFEQIRDGRRSLFSKDNFWWKTEPIDHNTFDHSTECFDANRVMIFENDLIKIKKEGSMQYTQRALVEYNEFQKSFLLNLLEEDRVIPFPKAQKDFPFFDQFKVTGQLYS